jgi:ribosomal protein L17
LPIWLLTPLTTKAFNNFQIMTIKKLTTAINNTKNQLITKAKSKGLYEKRKLKDKFINSSSYTDEMNEMRNLINNFSMDNDLK